MKEEFYRVVFELLPIPAWISAEETGCFLAVNKAATRLYGYTEQEFLAMPLASLALAEPPATQAVPLALGGFNSPPMEPIWHHRTKNGEGIEVQLQSQPIEFEGRKATLVLATELTARHGKDRRFEALVESAPDALLVVNQAGRIVLANAQVEKMFGYTREQLLGSAIEILVPDSSRGAHTEHRRSYSREPHARAMGLGLELHGRHKDGHEFPVEVSLSPIDTGEEALVASAIRDITERKKNEEGLRELDRQLRLQNAQLLTANQELESFAYSVSHDLRAPLRAIDGFGQALLEDCASQLSPECRDYLQRIRSATTRMGRLIDDLLTLARVTRAELIPERVSLSGLAQEIAVQFKTSEPGRDATFVIQPDLIVEGDRSLLRVLLENLLGNAWKFTSRRTDARIEVGMVKSDGANVYFVRDNGAGFDMKYADKLFGVFQRLHDSQLYEGTGVGLASVQRIARRHGGRIWAEGVPDEGATFYFQLSQSQS